MRPLIQIVIAAGFSVAVFGLVAQADDTSRAASAGIGMLATLLLLWQLVRCWDDTESLVHVLGVLLIVSLVIGAAATSASAINDAPPNPMLWAVLAHRLACVVVALLWSRWLTTTTRRRPLHERTHHGSPVPTAVLATRQRSSHAAR